MHTGCLHFPPKQTRLYAGLYHATKVIAPAQRDRIQPFMPAVSHDGCLPLQRRATQLRLPTSSCPYNSREDQDRDGPHPWQPCTYEMDQPKCYRKARHIWQDLAFSSAAFVSLPRDP